MARSRAPRAEAEHLLLSRQICFPLYAASRLVTRLYQPILAPHGLTYPQYVVMMILWETSPMTVSRIGERALLETNTLTPLLKRLEQLGYVRRERSSVDQRVVELHLTKAGFALKEACSCVPSAVFESVEFPRAKAIALKGLLDELVLRLSAADAPEGALPST